MRLLIISDTHTDSIEKLPSSVLNEIKMSDAVIHAGDIIGYKLIHDISHINKSVYAVRGNMDKFTSEHILPKKLELEFENVKIGVMHGDGSPYGLENRLMYSFEKVDIIIYGHTHKPFWGVINNIHLLNPGSPTDNRWTNQNSYAILNVNNGKFDAEVVYI